MDLKKAWVQRKNLGKFSSGIMLLCSYRKVSWKSQSQHFSTLSLSLKMKVLGQVGTSSYPTSLRCSWHWHSSHSFAWLHSTCGQISAVYEKSLSRKGTAKLTAWLISRTEGLGRCSTLWFSLEGVCFSLWLLSQWWVIQRSRSCSSCYQHLVSWFT